MDKTQLPALYLLMEACHRATSVLEINQLIRSQLRQLLPHQAAAYGVGELPSRKVIHWTNIDFPENYILDVLDKHDLMTSPVAKEWTQLLKPLFVAEGSIPTHYPLLWQQTFRSSGIGNVLVHGLVDVSGKTTSYFAFGKLPSPPKQEQLELVELLIPHLHVAISRALHLAAIPVDRSVLSKRELEIVKWVHQGKTNNEIAELLHISAFTVKNHVKNILDKLGAANRAHAVAKVLDLGLLD